MTKNHEEYKKIKEIVSTAIEEGKTRIDIDRETSRDWFRFFNYDFDPLISLNPEEKFGFNDFNLFVNRKAELKVISNYIGAIEKLPFSFHIAIIGPEGIGKHTTMKVICKIISENFAHIKFEFYNPKLKFDFKNGEDLKSKQLEEIEETSLDVRIISCVGKNKSYLINRIKNYRKNSKLIFSIWHVSEYPKNEAILVNKEIFFNNYSKDDLIEIFKRRISQTVSEEPENENYLKSLNNLFYPKIFNVSSGNLKLAFEVFKEIHFQAKLKGIIAFDSSIIDFVLKKFLYFKEIKLTRKEKIIINYYLSKDNIDKITTSNLVEELNFDRTIAWKYLERLTQKNVFEKFIYGNPSQYRINMIFLIFYEELLKKELIFKYK